MLVKISPFQISLYRSLFEERQRRFKTVVQRPIRFSSFACNCSMTVISFGILIVMHYSESVYSVDQVFGQGQRIILEKCLGIHYLRLDNIHCNLSD